MQFIVDLSSVMCVAAAGAGCVYLASGRRQSAWFWSLATALVFLAVWAVMISLYARGPFSPLRARSLLAAVCLVSAPWLLVALTMGQPDFRVAVSRWKGILIGQAAVGALSAAVMWAHGIDWVTGIGSEPAIVLTRWGLIAAAVSAAPACVALAIFLARLSNDVATMPAVWVGAVGASCGALWVSAGLLWRGYVSVTPLTSASAIGGAAALACTVGMAQGLTAARALAPSRRLVYGASAASLIVAYLLLARFAFNWAVELPGQAIRAMLPMAAFAAIAGLVVILGSQRSRHRLWVAIGRHFFQSKHDYGEVWINLTELVSGARDAPELVQRAAAFCRDLLCVPEVSIWLAGSAGQLSRSALVSTANGHVTSQAHAPTPSASTANGDSHGTTLPAAAIGEDGGGFAQAVGSAFACPMRANGRLLGFIAIGPSEKVKLDDEDRRVVRYVSAQLGSALGLHRLGEEIADAREIGSFHRVSAFVIHDLKNLVAQQSFVLENAGRFGGDPKFVADALAAFEDSTSRMRSLIGRLRSKETSAQPRHARCDLVELLREMVAMPRIALRNGCVVRLVVPEGVDACPVAVDRAALSQVFSNLLVNAVESLTAESSEVAVAVDKVTDGWRVQVRDSGRGMSDAFLRDHLFRPFRTTKETGLGIGLYQCKTIVEAVGGAIAVSSKQNVGTTISVTLPAEPARAGRAEAVIVGVQHGQTHSSGH